MSAKHTRGELRADDYISPPDTARLLDKDGRNILAPTLASENAARLALCWNMHDRLVTFVRGCSERSYHKEYADAILAEIDGAK